MASALKSKKGLICAFHTEYTCENVPRHFWGKIDIPPKACIIHDCKDCITVNKTFVLDENLKLWEPTAFILRKETKVIDQNSTTYACHTSDKTNCECDDDDCTGSNDFCAIRNCTHTSQCVCDRTYEKLEIVSLMEDKLLKNPNIVILKMCYFDTRVSASHSGIHRHLLEGENAVFQQNNLTIDFQDPILRLPANGRVILRSEDFEHIMSVPIDRMIKLPFELIAYKTDISIIYIHPSGRTVSGTIHVSGKSICQLRSCISYL